MKSFFQVGLFGSLLLTTACMGQKRETPKIDLSEKKILMIIASNNFRDEEYQKPRRIFEEAGAKITVASSALNTAKGMLGLAVKPDTLVTAVNAADFDAVIFVGGPGSTEYWNHPKAHQLAKDAFAAGKVIGAICLAPVTLANAGILKGKKATVFNTAAGQLKAKGVQYTGAAVEIADKIVTADGPASAEKFGHTVAKLLVEK